MGRNFNTERKGELRRKARTNLGIRLWSDSWYVPFVRMYSLTMLEVETGRLKSSKKLAVHPQDKMPRRLDTSISVDLEQSRLRLFYYIGLTAHENNVFTALYDHFANTGALSWLIWNWHSSRLNACKALGLNLVSTTSSILRDPCQRVSRHSGFNPSH